MFAFLLAYWFQMIFKQVTHIVLYCLMPKLYVFITVKVTRNNFESLPPKDHQYHFALNWLAHGF